MSPPSESASSAPRVYAVITGANSGVGLGIATRLLVQLAFPSRGPPSDAVVQAVLPLPLGASSAPTAGPPPTSSSSSEKPLPCPFEPNAGLTLVLACRNEGRALAAKEAILKSYKDAVGMMGGVTLEERRWFRESLEIVWEEVDLSEMKSVYSFIQRVQDRYPYISHLYLNAGVGSWAGINWPAAFREVITDPIGALTDPQYKKQHSGWKSDKDGLGWVWQCNVFGHWCIAKSLLGSLQKSPFPSSRIVWTTSHLSANAPKINTSDIQCLSTSSSYEESKRQVDVLSSYLDRELQTESEGSGKVRSLLCDPAVTATEIFRPQLGFVLYQLMMAAFYFVRFVLNSQNHPISLLSGTISFVTVGLLPASLIPSATPPSAPDAPSSLSSSSRLANYKFRSQADRWGKPYAAAHKLEWDLEEAKVVVGLLEGMRERWDRAYRGDEKESR